MARLSRQESPYLERGNSLQRRYTKISLVSLDRVVHSPILIARRDSLKLGILASPVSELELIWPGLLAGQIS